MPTPPLPSALPGARTAGDTRAGWRPPLPSRPARAQLKAVFAKTGTRRQAELVRLPLVGMPPGTE